MLDASGTAVPVSSTGVTVKMSANAFIKSLVPSSVKVAYVSDDGATFEPVSAWVKDGYLYINTTHLSNYVVYGQVASSDYTPPTTTPTTPTTQPMYRMYNKWSGEHLFTSDASELKKNVKLGWKNEGVAWNAPTSGTKVYRLYNKYSGDHHFTTDVNEYNKCKKAGWTGEGVAFYSGGDQPVYRLYNKYVTSFYHHYTMDVKEQKKCIKDGWKDEKIGWYGYAA